ncbi:insulin-induced protein-domain-containing protein [Pyrenochaeta sp. MPI-SDFR-AT-0127]|nr:insulin-induced protein-domain-containing protein [Pyrenochaeta sp. MPI-SDFR-AT-0127]
MADDASVSSNAAQGSSHIYRPIARRNFDNTSHNDSAGSPTHAFTQSTPPSATESRRSSDFLAQLNARLLRTYNSRNEEAEEQEKEKLPPPPRNKSFLNMTSSTLFGIYDDVGSGTAGERSMAETPWGTGAETPARSGMGIHTWDTGMGSPDAGLSMTNQARRGTQRSCGKRNDHTTKQPRQGPWKFAVVLGKLSALYAFGVIYGLIVSHLHETRQLAAVHVEGVDRSGSIYLASWGLFGVVLGSLLPYVDLVWDSQKLDTQVHEKETDRRDSPISEQINDVVRSVCAFIGIAFAIRRLPWQSTLQLTLTLALVNPALWYILDRSKPGLSFSLAVTSILTSFIFLSNPNVLPSPPLPTPTNITQLPASSNSMGSKQNTAPVEQDLFAGIVSYENLAVVTWVGSVLFCSCVCFGSIGRRLAVLEESGWKR